MQLQRKTLVSVAPLVFAYAAVTLTSACGHESKTETEAAADVEPGSDYNGTVKTCHDGDTCVIRLDNGQGDLKVRFIGMDAPEVSGGDDGQGQPLGKEARNQLNALIKGETVRVHAVKHDMYDRMLSEIYLGDTLVNVEMIKRGMAEEYVWSPSEVDAHAYRAAEQDAKAEGRGIWSLEHYERPQDFRERTRDDH
jgi:micrococcal nuclease